MKTMEERLLDEIAEKQAEIESLKEQLDTAEDALNYLIMGGV